MTDRSEAERVALKPCPFCGGAAAWVEDPGVCDVPFGLVSEHTPNCFMGPAIMNDAAAIIAAWNTRTTLQENTDAQ